MSIRIAAVTIGAAPRPDLTASLRAALPGVEVIELGALDGFGPGASPPAPGQGGYPLRTRASDGRIVIADEAWLAPRVQAAVDRGESAGADLTILLCAGGFASVKAGGPLIRPFDVAVGRLDARGARRIGVLVPFEGQVAPSRAKWTDAGFDVDVVVGAPAEAGRFLAFEPVPDAIVLDYVGHSPVDLQAALAAVRVAADAGLGPPVPVVDLLAATVEAAVATMGR